MGGRRDMLKESELHASEPHDPTDATRNPVRSQTLRRALMVYLALLIPIAWLAMKYGPYAMDGDGMAYMDIAGLMRAHHWAGVVNGYWNPLYPAGLALVQDRTSTRLNSSHRR